MTGRMQPVHKVMTLKEAGLSKSSGWDDELHFNTQVRPHLTVELVTKNSNEER
jgi:hypothetical protein